MRARSAFAADTASSAKVTTTISQSPETATPIRMARMRVATGRFATDRDTWPLTKISAIPRAMVAIRNG